MESGRLLRHFALYNFHCRFSTSLRKSTGRTPTILRGVATRTSPKKLEASESTILDADAPVSISSSEVEKRSQIFGKSAEWDIDFSSVKNAYKSKSTAELFRAMLVYKLCTIDKLVDNNAKLANFAYKVLGPSLFKYVMTKSFYGQFVAGENENEIKPVIQKMQSHGVGAILDYAVEEDISEEEAKELEMSSCISDTNASQTGTVHNKFKAHREFGDRRRRVFSARTYFYKDESKCDDNMKMFMKCIDAAGTATSGGFAAIKLTALGRPQFLLQFSDALIRARSLFNQLSVKDVPILEKGFDINRFRKKARSLGIPMNRDESREWFTWMDVDDSGFVDLLDWNQLISSNKKFSEIFVVANPQTGEMESLLNDMSDEEDAQMRRMLKRMDTLAHRAQSLGVRLMIDAEQTYFQPAISRITIEMMRRFNKESPVIFNTYQCYLKEAENHITVDLALALRENFYFGCKLVRGAYMEQERERATTLGYEDPIQSSYEATNENYLKSLDLLLHHIKTHKKANVMVASHNEDSIKCALERMCELGISAESKTVFFGQLLGMCDHVTYPLGQAGHSVFKYVPFGPVREVMPYLSRRAQENRGMLIGAQKERKMLQRELFRRAFGVDMTA